MKYLLKVCFCFGLAMGFALGTTDIAFNQLNQSIVEVKTELFASADDDSKKNRKKKKKKKTKKKKKKLQARTING
tara:strand:+ start:481 stop:705 length:225 start_codon:yes stop_codon:yes gene_type:complete